MFSKATANFVRQVDPEGSLINVSRLNDSDKLVPMALVIKRNRFWFWQKPKYQPADFNLSDLLGDPVIQPGVLVTDFLKTFKGNFGDAIFGKLGAEAGGGSISVEGKGTTKLESFFGPLKKEELDVRKLVRESCNRYVDMEHQLVKQLEKKADVLALVKERILTTSSCSISQTKKDQCTCQGLLRLLGGSSEFCVKDSNTIEVDCDVSLEIPPGTVIAYSIFELEIKKDGHLTICLQPRCIGGFEADTIALSWPSNVDLNAVDGRRIGQEDIIPLSLLLNGSEEMDLSPLAALPPSSQQVFFEMLLETIMDRPALTSLQFVLEELCSGEGISAANTDKLSERHSKLVAALLGQPSSNGRGENGHGENGHGENGHSGVPAHLNAAHMLVSAMEELPDETLKLLSKTRPDFLKALDTLMCRFKESCEPLSVQTLPVPLQDNQSFQPAEQLLASAKVALRRNDGQVWTETGIQAGVLPLVLWLSIHGLAILCSGLN